MYYLRFASRFFMVGLVGSLLFFLPSQSQALTLSSPRDCDANAVIDCGALTTAELAQKYQADGIGPIYARFGITGQEITNMGANSDAEHTYAGSVTRSGQVIVDQIDINGRTYSDKVVATDALTAGRQNMPGSTQQSSGGITFFSRPPSVSFVSSPLPAFVVMENGRFAFAIIASCGNPVKATPVIFATPAPQPKPAPTPTPSVPTSQPPVQTPAPPAAPPVVPTITITNTNTQSQSQSQAQGGTGGGQSAQTAGAAAQATTPATQATSQAQVAAPASAPAAAPQTTALPNTGPGNALALSSITTVFGTLGHFLYRRRKLV